MNAAAQPLLAIRDLRVTFRTDDGPVDAVRGIDLSINPGEVVALVCESGSGKSVTAMAVLALLPDTASRSGSIRFDGRELTELSEDEMNGVRGRSISMVFQEPMTALNPSIRVGHQIAEVIRNHEEISAEAALERAVELLRSVGIPEPEHRVRAYPHELSGGQRQRVVIAIALACSPALIIADEPTTALDVTVQAEILDLLRSLARSQSTAILLVTHNMGVVADIADRVAVMFRGEMVETGATEQVLKQPEQPYTQKLLAAVPRLPQLDDAAELAAVATESPVLVSERTAAAASAAPVAAVRVDHARVEYRRAGQPFLALDDVSLSLAPGEILGLVGESGSGKSTLGRAILGLTPLSSGEITLFGEAATARGLRGSSGRALRGRIGAVFQDPGSSLDPRMTVGDAIAEPLVVHRKLVRLSRAERAARVRELIEAVELPAAYARRYPHELSGGQRQRIGLARAIALEPELIIADEPTSALDVSVQAAVLDVLRSLQQRMNFACLFISHDLAVVHEFSDRVAVMHLGNIVEIGPSAEVLQRPRHEYSQRLLASVPVPDPAVQAARREVREAVEARA